jgi:hypothetical protein
LGVRGNELSNFWLKAYKEELAPGEDGVIPDAGVELIKEHGYNYMNMPPLTKE